MSNLSTIGLRALVFPVAFAAILGCVQLRIEAGEHAGEMTAAAKTTAGNVAGYVGQAVASVFDGGKKRITIASR